MVGDIESEPTIDEHSLPSSTRAWVESVAGENARVVRVERLIGGWTSEMRRLQVRDPGGERTLVLRSFVKPFFVKHAEGLLNREAAILQLLSGSAIPAAGVIAVDALATHCAFPSLLRTHLPGAIRLGDEGADQRIALLAALLVTIHRLPVADARRPRTYQAWTRHDVVKIPADTTQRPAWEQAIDVIRRPPPAYEGCFLHRDFHPGNVLFEAASSGIAPALRGGAMSVESAAPRITGVVDWVETSWGPADLDVAHCSTALALLHGADVGLHFVERYTQAGGRVSAAPHARLYWSLIDALHYSPHAEKLAEPWREAGRPDLTPELLAVRLESYVLGLLSRLS